MVQLNDFFAAVALCGCCIFRCIFWLNFQLKPLTIPIICSIMVSRGDSDAGQTYTETDR